MTEPVTLSTLLEGVTSLWKRGARALWALVVSDLSVLAALGAGAYFGVGNANAILASWGVPLGLALLVLIVFAAFKTHAERPLPILSILPREAQSLWAQSRQANGEITTQLSLRFQVTNLSDNTVMLSGIRLQRPFVLQSSIMTSMLIVRHPTQNIYSSQHPVLPHSLTDGSATIIISRAIGTIGHHLRVVIGLQDHAGRWHKVVFPRVPMVGSGPTPHAAATQSVMPQ